MMISRNEVYFPERKGLKNKRPFFDFMIRRKPTHILRYILLLFLAACTIPIFWNSMAMAAENPESAGVTDEADIRYRAAKDYYYRLMRDKVQGELRDNWLVGARNFRRIYLDHPKHKLAPSCLFMMGKIHRSMYNHFHNPADSNDAIYYFNDVANIYSRHRLADDALFAIAEIYLTDMENPKKAIAVLTSLISRYPSGDQYARAVNRLQQISSDNQIPLSDKLKRSGSLQHLVNVLPVKYWSSDEYTRVAIKTSKPVDYKATLLERVGDKPRRLYIDFAQSYIPPKFRSLVPIEDGLLKQVRTGQFNPSTVRVVLDIESISDYKIFNMKDPFRVIVDVRGEKKKPPVAVPQKVQPKGASKPKIIARPPIVEKQKTPQVKQKQPLADEKAVITKHEVEQPEEEPELISLRDQKKKRPAQVSNGKRGSTPAQDSSFSLAQQLGLGVRHIVIDPGHGGKDPGAMAFGLKEKNIVLKVAKKLAVTLREKHGFIVQLTRTGDTFLQLEERTAIANTKKADLFVSIHINAHPQPSVHGIETFFLNLATNDEAMRVAARENATTSHNISDMQDILSDLMQNSKIEESSRLAEFVQTSMISGLQNHNYRVKNLGVKQAPFYVLIGAEMPAILAEISFVTNPQEAERLKQDTYLQHLAEQIAVGVVDYVRNSTTAGLQL